MDTNEHRYIVKNNTNQILYFAIWQDKAVHILYIYVAESEQILKNMFADRYYGSLNPGKSMRLEAASPKAEIKDFVITFKIETILHKHIDFKEYEITVIPKSVPSQLN